MQLSISKHNPYEVNISLHVSSTSLLVTSKITQNVSVSLDFKFKFPVLKEHLNNNLRAQKGSYQINLKEGFDQINGARVNGIGVSFARRKSTDLK